MFEIEIEENEYLYIELRGELDPLLSKYFKERIYNLMIEGKINIVLDFSKLESISLIGFGILKTIFKDIEAMGGTLYIIANEKYKQFFNFSNVFLNREEVEK